MAVTRLSAEQLLAFYAAARDDAQMRSEVIKHLERSRTSTKIEDGIRVAAFVVAALLALGFVGLAITLVAAGEILWGVAFGGGDLFLFVRYFLPNAIVQGSGEGAAPAILAPSPQTPEAGNPAEPAP